jgi:hypothetical protein
MWTSFPLRSIKYTDPPPLIGENNVKPGELRAASSARNPVPLRLIVFWSTLVAGVANRLAIVNALKLNPNSRLVTYAAPLENLVERDYKSRAG